MARSKPPPSGLTLGDPCRAAGGEPARYIGDARCCYVNQRMDGIGLCRAVPARGDEYLYPLPRMRTLRCLQAMAQRYMEEHEASGQLKRRVPHDQRHGHVLRRAGQAVPGLPFWR